MLRCMWMFRDAGHVQVGPAASPLSRFDGGFTQGRISPFLELAGCRYFAEEHPNREMPCSRRNDI